MKGTLSARVGQIQVEVKSQFSCLQIILFWNFPPVCGQALLIYVLWFNQVVHKVSITSVNQAQNERTVSAGFMDKLLISHFLTHVISVIKAWLLINVPRQRKWDSLHLKLSHTFLVYWPCHIKYFSPVCDQLSCLKFSTFVRILRHLWDKCICDNRVSCGEEL